MPAVRDVDVAILHTHVREALAIARNNAKPIRPSRPPPHGWVEVKSEDDLHEFRTGLEDDCDRYHETWVFGEAMSIIALLYAARALDAIYEFWLKRDTRKAASFVVSSGKNAGRRFQVVFNKPARCFEFYDRSVRPMQIVHSVRQAEGGGALVEWLSRLTEQVIPIS
jgi:hypothetical protein